MLEIFYDPIVEQWPDFVDAHLASAELSLAKYDNALAAEMLTKAPDDGEGESRVPLSAWRARICRTMRAAATEAIEAALADQPAARARRCSCRSTNSSTAEQYDDAEEAARRDPRSQSARATRVGVQGRAGASGERRGAREGGSRSRARRLGRQSGGRSHDRPQAVGQVPLRRRRRVPAAGAGRWTPRTCRRRCSSRRTCCDWARRTKAGQLASDVFDADGYNVVAHNLVTLHDSDQGLPHSDERVVPRADGGPRGGDLRRSRARRCSTAPRRRCARSTTRRSTGPIAVEIFPQQKDFAVRTFGLPGADGFLGVCFGNVITANSPAALGGRSRANWESVLWHEFCHVVTLRKSHNKMPRWLSEGISVYEERQDDPTWGQSMTPEYRELILGGKMPPVSELSGSFLAPESPMALQFAYFESSLVVEYIIEQYGLDALKQVLDDLGGGMAIEESLVRNVAPLNRLDDEFEEFARERAEKLAPELSWEEADLPPRADAVDDRRMA